jgi:LytR cell envelope-related transcriptional attenuator
MSMLTPPGMGGKYRVTGTQYPRMRRPRRRGRIMAAAVAVTAVLGVLGWGGSQLIDVFGGGGNTTKAAARKPASCRRATPSPSTSPVSFTLPKPTDVTVNIYNATTRSGLAKKTADALAARGFDIGAFGNADPAYDQRIEQAALLLAGPDGQAAARTVSAQFAGTAAFKTDPKRKGTTVDLLIGKAFTKLNGAAAVRKAMSALAHPAPSPAPTTRKVC